MGRRERGGRVSVKFGGSVREQAAAMDFLSVLGGGSPYPKCQTCGGVLVAQAKEREVAEKALCTCPRMSGGAP